MTGSPDAAYHGHGETVAALLKSGAEPDRLNDGGQSPLALLER